MLTIDINRQDFRAWLMTQAVANRIFAPVPTKLYGPSWCCGCPLATYAREVLGYPDAAWDGNRLSPGDDIDKVLQAPRWTAEFVDAVDRWNVDNIPLRSPVRVPSTEALAILDELP